MNVTDSFLDYRFTDACNEVLELYDNDRLDEWVEKAREIINGPGTTRYHRMKMLIFPSSTLGEWEEAEECRYAAETLWRVHRSWHPEGKNEELDIYMVEIRVSLDKLGAVSKQEESELDDEVLDEYGRPVDTASLMSNFDINKTSNISSKEDEEDPYNEEIDDEGIFFFDDRQEQIERARRDNLLIATSTLPKTVEELQVWRFEDDGLLADLNLDPALKAVLVERLARVHESAADSLRKLQNLNNAGPSA
jgi:hypothetical protein